MLKLFLVTTLTITVFAQFASSVDEYIGNPLLRIESSKEIILINGQPAPEVNYIIPNDFCSEYLQ